MTIDSIAAEEAILSKSGSLIYEIATRGASQWTKKGTEHDKNPQHLNCAKTIILELRSTWNNGKHNVDIQYVPGANTIFVNDYVDDKGETQKGLRSQGYDLKNEDYRRAVEEDIKFINGFLYVERYGGESNWTLMEYLKHHASNTSSPNYKKDRRRNTLFLFAPLVKEKKSVASLENLEIENEAHNLFTGLREVKKNGKDFTYDVAKIDALCAIFEVGGGLGANESSQKMMALRPLVRNNPAEFMATFTDTKNEYLLTIGTAITLEVLQIDDKKVKLNLAENTPIDIKYVGKSADVKENLAYHFLGNDAGKVSYQQILGEVERKKIAALAK